MAVLRALAPRAAEAGGVTVSALLRPSTISSKDADKQKDVAVLRALGVTLMAGDIVAASVGELAALFAPHDEIISCIGFAAGRGTQLKLAEVALQAGVRRYFPWQFGVDYDVLGRGSAQDLFDERATCCAARTRSSGSSCRSACSPASCSSRRSVSST